ncbi:outer membrane protein assembly factor [Psychromonas sp. RZ22]|uniref:autotransporter assembly complex protein TamA n=1 Tax=Psychromonas algarum TaxID=2555643 RepID=UPI0010678410|nr:autotransporter assembly complex family protein [Psychromonas sp. RZ22]TEW55237.1 outer membrane protein assembly factor [Psychromonas sp. RZ22]
MNKRYKFCIFCLLITCLSFKVMASVSFDIEGVEEDDQAKENISVFLKGLTVPEDADNESYLIEVESSTKESLIALGYYQTEVISSVTSDEKDQVVTVTVNLGPRTVITQVDLRITGEAVNNRHFQKFMVNLPIKEGQFLDHGKYAETKSAFKSLAQRYGYFDAKYTKSAVEVTQKNNTAVVILWFDSGVRYEFGELIFDNQIPSEKFVRALANFQPGDPYDSTTLNQFNEDLNETGYFKSITILPAIENKQDRKIPLHVIASKSPEDSFNAGFGYGTDNGLRGKFSWNRPWINKYGHSIGGSLIASAPMQEATLTYKMPIDEPLYHYDSIQSGYKMLDQNDTDTTQYVVGYYRHWKLDNTWLRTVYLRYDNESGRQGQQDFATELILPGISFSRTRSRGDINIDWGDKLLTYFEFANKNLFSSSTVVKLYAQSKIIRTYQGHQFVASAQAGGILANSIYNVPSSMRFFTGGDQSIRGYGYNEIAPRDTQDYLVGGYYLATTSLEYRYPIAENWKIAVFTDAGTATDDFAEPLSISTGTGLVWASPVGPVRLYFAVPLTDTSDNFRVHFMIGPEL